MEVKDWLALGGLLLSTLTFYLGRITAASNKGKEDGASIATLATKITYIESAVGRIESGMSTDIGRLDGRLTEMSNQLYNAGTMATRAMESSKMAHNRLNEHLRREHNLTVVDYTDTDACEEKFK